MQSALKPEVFRKLYKDFAKQNPLWNEVPASTGNVYQWDAASTYIHEPPFFTGFSLQPGEIGEIKGARPLGIFGDSVTTDHISPAGSIPADSPAGRYLIAQGVSPRDFNSYGARRGNHEVMVRGTFANIRLRNQLVPGIEGGWTRHQPDGDQMTIYDASVRYQAAGVPLLVLAGKDYGVGSSRDWAAKGTVLLGVRAVIAESYERIHRSNLVNMGVLPLQFRPGESVVSLTLTGREEYRIGVEDLKPRGLVTVRLRGAAAATSDFQAIVRIDTPEELVAFRHGGILPYVLRQLVGAR
jgi:aconitate hydratase